MTGDTGLSVVCLLIGDATDLVVVVCLMIGEAQDSVEIVVVVIVVFLAAFFEPVPVLELVFLDDVDTFFAYLWGLHVGFTSMEVVTLVV